LFNEACYAKNRRAVTVLAGRSDQLSCLTIGRDLILRFCLIVALDWPLGVTAQAAGDAQTLAGCASGKLTVLNVEVQKLRRGKLSTSGSASVRLLVIGALSVFNAMESELQRLTSKTERAGNQINRWSQMGPTGSVIWTIRLASN